jgi:hypothetical protein
MLGSISARINLTFVPCTHRGSSGSPYASSVPNWIYEARPCLLGHTRSAIFSDHVQPLSADDEDHFPLEANWAIRAKERRAFRYDRELGAVPKRTEPMTKLGYRPGSQLRSNGLLDTAGDGRTLYWA